MGEQTRANAALVMDWFQKRKGVAGIAEIRLSGLLDARAAQAAVGYAVRHGALEVVKASGDGGERRVLYKGTGRPLPAEKPAIEADLSFGPLLSAWGFPCNPPELPSLASRRVELLY